MGQSIRHIACAAGDSEHGRNRGGTNDASLYPHALALRRFHSVPVNYENPMRNHNMYNFWVACKQIVSEEGGAVLVHCNNSFHRGPLAVAAIMVRAGYKKDSAMSALASRRHIYPGHIIPLQNVSLDLSTRHVQ